MSIHIFKRVTGLLQNGLWIMTGLMLRQQSKYIYIHLSLLVDDSRTYVKTKEIYSNKS